MPVLTKINTNSIAEDAITGDKFAGDAYLANTANQNISGTYSENRLYTSDAYTLSGNATVNSHLTLSSVKPTADVVLTASGAYTITGTGVLSAGSLLAKANTDLTGMTGELGSTVTGAPNLNLTTGTISAGVALDSGMVTRCWTYIDDTSGNITQAGTTAAKVASRSFAIPAISGRKYVISGQQHMTPNNNASGSHASREQFCQLWYGTTLRTVGATQTGDTRLTITVLGRTMASATTADAIGSFGYAYNGSFTAASSVTHYFYTAISVWESNVQQALAVNTTFNPHTAFVLEVMP
ncbi:uncharacterized protein METZ01_LOCUS165046 [marine metagenome]|uniref:Uncharacterized protein n=1 Tax=marine metagenome TaxID=408172 RepID=A0A382BFY6_9ZZZZ